MGNTKGKPTARSDIEPARYVQQSLEFLFVQRNSYFSLLPRELVLSQLAPYAQDALCGTIILRRADDLPVRFPAPLAFDVVKTALGDLGNASKVPVFLAGIIPYRDSSNSVDTEFVGAVERLLQRIPIASTDTVHGLLYLRDPAFLPLGVRLSTVIEKTSSGFVAFTAHGIWIASDRCKAWISWRNFIEAEMSEPFEEQYYVHNAESTDIREPVRYLSIQLPKHTRHLLPCHWARSIDIVRQATVIKLFKEAEAAPNALTISPPKTLRERLLECWPSRQTYAYRTNMLEYRILPLFASIWLQPGIPSRVLQKVLCLLGRHSLLLTAFVQLPSDDDVWALFRAKTRDGPLVLTSTCVMWKPKGKEEVMRLELEQLAACDLSEHKGKRIIFKQKDNPKPLVFRHLQTEKLGAMFLTSSPFQLLRVVQWVLWEMRPEWNPSAATRRVASSLLLDDPTLASPTSTSPPLSPTRDRANSSSSSDNDKEPASPKSLQSSASRSELQDSGKGDLKSRSGTDLKSELKNSKSESASSITSAFKEKERITEKKEKEREKGKEREREREKQKEKEKERLRKEKEAEREREKKDKKKGRW